MNPKTVFKPFNWLLLSSALLCSALPSQASVTIPDFQQITDIQTRKSSFFNFLKPFVQAANREIMRERRWLTSLDFKLLTETEKTRVKGLMKKYRLKGTSLSLQTQLELLKRIDLIPDSMALAQAANESAWGTSRFAREGNNYFGQWCFKPGCGLVPLRRAQGDTHEVKKFDTPLESVKSYMRTLNSHPAFKPLRQARFELRQAQKPLKGLHLVEGLEPYSALKGEYVDIIASMIRSNRLTEMDG